MSLILDALRKSERSRQQSLTGRLGAGETPPPARTRLPVPWVTLLGVLLLVNAVVLGVLFLGPRSVPEASPPAAAPPPTPAPSPVPSPAYHPSVRPLSQEAGTPPSNAAEPAAAVPQQAQLPLATNAAALPSYDSLTPDQRQGLPALHLDVLGYTQKAAERFVVINLKRYTSGETLAEGPTVKDILPEGAVLEYHGLLFLLPAS